jgi:hypothetical protein
MKKTALAQYEVSPEVEKGIKALTKYADELNITSLAEAEDAGNKIYQISDLKKKVEDQRTAITKPMNLALRAANAFFKRFSVPLETIDAQLREKVKLYGMESENNVMGVVHLKNKTVIKVTEPSKLKRKYLMPDLDAIKKAIEAGEEVEGVEIINDKIVSL